jgi:hypothetical protein
MGEGMRTAYRISYGLAFLLAAVGSAHAAATKASYPAMAPVEQYLMKSSDEIALARSAAPASISNDAEILTLTGHGYETAVKGKNGFVCLIERSWENDFSSPEFWNQNMRAPLCLNPAAVRTILPAVRERAAWAVSGLSKDEIQSRVKASPLANTAPEEGAMSYMMSKGGHLSDSGGHWHPHVMFWLGRGGAASWGANLPGSPVLSAPGDAPVTLFFVLVPKWSDGTPAMDMHA